MTSNGTNDWKIRGIRMLNKECVCSTARGFLKITEIHPELGQLYASHEPGRRQELINLRCRWPVEFGFSSPCLSRNCHGLDWSTAPLLPHNAITIDDKQIQLMRAIHDQEDRPTMPLLLYWIRNKPWCSQKQPWRIHGIPMACGLMWSYIAYFVLEHWKCRAAWQTRGARGCPLPRRRSDFLGIPSFGFGFGFSTRGLCVIRMYINSNFIMNN